MIYSSGGTLVTISGVYMDSVAQPVITLTIIVTKVTADNQTHEEPPTSKSEVGPTVMCKLKKCIT